LKDKLTTDFSTKEKIFAFIESTRPYTLLWCGLVSLSGACIAKGSFPDYNISLLITFIPIMGWIAGLFISDFFDRRLDQIQKNHRPIPSGRIKSYEILIIGTIFGIIGLILSYRLGLDNLIIALLAALLVLSYTKFSKSRGMIGNINRGLITGIAFFFGVFSIYDSIIFIPSYIWFISLVFIIHDINSNLIGAIRDVKGDEIGGYLTFPVKYGVKKSIIVAVFLTIIWLILALYIPYFYGLFNYIYYVLLSFVILFIFILYLCCFRLLDDVDRRKALKAHEFFVIERVTLAAAFIFGVSNLFPALIIYLIAVSLTIILQYFLRDRYEFGKRT
jgi:4-hydroxybenzoate polyprenyltransferase/geranylgeranylglycerol-phosphate geranylgeranyltransferase